ncbi:MAG: hemagglutinin repeat-containing protein [Epsilonproteobacteria bacterium]|nr:hemagglutinin repeat-containing protein [Campylobacterota bacterium]
MTAGNNLDIYATNRARVHNGGTFAANGNVNITALDHINNTSKGKIQAGKNLTLYTKNLYNQYGGLLSSGGTLRATASESVQNYGKGNIVTGGDINVNTKYLYAKDSKISALKNVTLKSYLSELGQSETLANGTLTIQASKLDTSRARLKANNINVNAYSLINSGGMYDAYTSLKLNTAYLGGVGKLKSYRDLGVKITRGGLTLNSGESIEAGDQLALDVRGGVLNTKYAKLYSRNALNIKASSLTNTGLISSGRNTLINAYNITNTNGRILAGDNLALFAPNTIVNSGKYGVIQANNNLLLAANDRGGLSRYIRNSDGTIKSVRGSVFIDSQQFENVGTKGKQRYYPNQYAKVSAGGDVVIANGNVKNYYGHITAGNNALIGGLTGSGSSARSNVSSISNMYSTISARNALQLTAKNNIYNYRSNVSGNDVSLLSDAGNVGMYLTSLNAKRDLAIKSDKFTSNSLLKSGRDISLELTKSGFNNSGYLGAKRDLNIMASGKIQNFSGKSLTAGGNLYLKGSSIENNGYIRANRDLTLVGHALTNKQIGYRGATLQAGNDLNIFANYIANSGYYANILARNDMHIAGRNPRQSAQYVSNYNGKIRTDNGYMNIATNNLSNRSSYNPYLYKRHNYYDIRTFLKYGNFDQREGTGYGRAEISSGGNLYIKNTTNSNANLVTSITNPFSYYGMYGYYRNYRNSITNDHSTIKAKGDIVMTTANNIVNNAGYINGRNISMVSTAGGFQNKSDIRRMNAYTYKDRQSGYRDGIVAKGLVKASGALQIKTRGPIDFTAAKASAREISLKSLGDVNLNARAVYGYTGSQNNFLKTKDYKTSELYAWGGPLSIQSRRNINLNAAKLQATNYWRGNLILDASGSINTRAYNDRDYQHYYHKSTSRTWYGKKKTKIHQIEDVRERVNNSYLRGSSIAMLARNNISLNAATAYSSRGDIQGKARNVYANAHKYVSDRKEYRKKTSSWLGIRYSSDISRLNLSSHYWRSTSLISRNDIRLRASNSMNIIGSRLKANNLISLYAGNNLSISNVMEQEFREEERRSSGIGKGGNLYASANSLEGYIKQKVKGSMIEADRVSINAGSANIIGSDILGKNGIDITTRTGDVNIQAVVANNREYSSKETLKVSLGDFAKTITNPLSAVKIKDGRASLSLAKATYDKMDKDLSTDTVVSTTLKTLGGTVAINSAKDINILGSKIETTLRNADGVLEKSGDIILQAEKDIKIAEVQATTTDHTKEIHGEGEISLTVQHQAVEVVKAAQALKTAKDQLSDSKKKYDTYKDNLKKYESQLAKLKSEYNAKKPGVSLSDIKDLERLIQDSKEDEKWYVTNIAAATANLTSKTTLLAQQTAAAAQSTSTYGFNAGLQLDIDASAKETGVTSVASTGSTLEGKNITIQAGDKATIKGSVVKASETLGINAKTLELLASQDSSTTQTDNKHGHITVSQTIHNAATGPSVNANFDKSTATQKSITHTNALLLGDNVKITTEGDMKVEGANIHANSKGLLNVGGDLSFASVQDISSHKSNSAGLSAGAGINSATGVSANSGGVNFGNARGYSKKTVVASITSNGTLDVNVKGHTELVGATIATVDEEGEDSGKLNFSTGTFDFANLSDTDTSSSTNAGVGVGSTTTVNYHNGSDIKVDKTLATIGKGIFNVAGDTYDESNLNRDITTTTKRLYDVTQSNGDFDVVVDNRLLTVEGRKQIHEDVKRTEILAESIKDLTKESVSFLGNQGNGETNLKNHIEGKQNYFTATKKFVEIGNQAHIDALQNQNASPEKKQAAYTALVSFIADEMGVTPTVAKVMVDNHNKGFYSHENGNIYIADNLHGNSLESVETLGHETQHLIDFQKDKDITKTANYDNNREEYADIMGDATGDYLDFQYSSNGYSALASVVNNHNGVATASEIQNGLLTQNTREFNSLDRDLGDDSLFKLATLTYKIGNKIRKLEGKLTGTKFKKILKDEGIDILDDIGTLLDGELTVDDAMAVLDLIAGTELNSKTNAKSAIAKEFGDKLKSNAKDGKPSVIVRADIKVKPILGKVDFFKKYPKNKFTSEDHAKNAWIQYQKTINTKKEIVIGRLDDTKAGGQLGFERLSTKDWDIEVNRAWIQGGIDTKKKFYLGSNIDIQTLRNSDPGSSYKATVYLDELKQLKNAGYCRQGDYMVPCL